MTPACKHDDSSLFVQSVLAPQLVSPGQACDFTSDPTQAALPSGILDVALRTEYDPVFLLGNQMVAEVNSQQLQTETSIITVRGAVVRVTDISNHQLTAFTTDGSTTVYPSTGSTPGYAPISVTAIDQATAIAATAGLASGATVRLITYTKFFGNTLGGDSIESDEFEFPVDLCFGCLITFAEDNPALMVQPNCALAAAAATVSSLPSPCSPGQDEAVDCSQCLDNAVCNPQQ